MGPAGAHTRRDPGRVGTATEDGPKRPSPVASGRRLSPLALLHPEGRAACALVLGARALPSLLDGTEDDAGRQAADVVLVAPSGAELEQDGGLDGLVRRAAAVLAPDGLAYVVVPGGSRRLARSALDRAGLSAQAEFVHVPDADHPRLLVPLAAAPVRFALARLARRTLAWRLARLTAPLPLALPLAAARRSIGIVGRPPGSRPLLGWLHALGIEPGHVVVQTSARPGNPDLVLYALQRGSAVPAAVVKVSAEPSRLDHEARALRDLGATARAAGADVARPLAERNVDGIAVLVQTAVAGRVLAHQLAGAPRSFPPAMERVADWLAAWHRLSARPRELTADVLEAEVLAPGRLVSAALDDGGAYLGRLKAVCARAEGMTMALVASHGDLTSINLLAERGRLAVVDWEHARDDGLPLADFVYAAADAAAAVARHRDRTGAFEDCFVPGRRWTELVARLARRVRDAAGLSAEAAELCFQACWAHHAANELRASGGRPGEFVQLAARAGALRRAR